MISLYYPGYGLRPHLVRIRPEHALKQLLELSSTHHGSHMDLHRKSPVIAFFLHLAGVIIFLITGIAVVAYAGLMITWMHAPVLPVIGVTAVFALPFALLSWGAFVLARRVSGVHQ
jgi:hypothetical protein